MKKTGQTSSTNRIPSHKQPLSTVYQQSNITINSIQILERKYQEQKQILQMQNKKLQQQLYQQLTQSQQKRLQFQKLEQRHKQQNQLLRMQNEALKNKLQLKLQQQNEPSESLDNYDSDHEQVQKQYLKMHKQLLLKYQKLESQYEQMQQLLIQQDQQKERLLRDNDQQSQHIQRLKMKILKQQQQFVRSKQLVSGFVKQKQEINLEFNKYTENILSLQTKLKQKQFKISQLTTQLNSKLAKVDQQKLKRKQTEKTLKQLEAKFSQYESVQKQRYEQAMRRMEQELGRQKSQTMQLTTKLSFSQISIQKKDVYLRELEDSLKEQTARKEQLQIKLTSQEKHIKQLKQKLAQKSTQLLRQRQQTSLQKQKYAKRFQQQVLQLKKKTIQQVYPILKDKNEQRSKKNFQSYLRNCKSSGQMTGAMKVAFNQRLDQNETEIGSLGMQNPLQRFKLETEVNRLELETQSLRKQLDTALGDAARTKEQMNVLRGQLDSKARQIQQMALKLQKAQQSKSNEILQMRRQLSGLKAKQTEMLEVVRDREEYEEAMTLKISFYDKKIKELLQNLQRKQNIIQKLKLQRVQNQQKVKFYEQKLQKLSQQAESGKRLKGDLSRKDELYKDYKLKFQQKSEQLQKHRQSTESIRRQARKLQLGLQAKQQYILSLKKKHKKQVQQQSRLGQERIKQVQIRQGKVMKQGMENKVKKVKKQIDGLKMTMQGVRNVVLQEVDKYVNKERTRKTGKQKYEQYEAAKLLGLNGAEMRDFMNPDQAQQSQVHGRLENLWQEQQFERFVEEGFEFVSRKLQKMGGNLF